MLGDGLFFGCCGDFGRHHPMARTICEGGVADYGTDHFGSLAGYVGVGRSLFSRAWGLGEKEGGIR